MGGARIRAAQGEEHQGQHTVLSAQLQTVCVCEAVCARVLGDILENMSLLVYPGAGPQQLEASSPFPYP